MPYDTMLTLMTFCFTAIFTMLSKNYVNALPNRNDYELFQNGFTSSDVQADNVWDNILRLLLSPETHEQTSAIENEQTREINPFLSSDYLNKDTLYPLMDDEQFIIEMPESGDQIVSKNEFKADDIEKYATPGLSKLLKLIDHLKLPEYKQVSTKEAKRGWNSNGAFDTLVSAVGRLGRLNDKESKSESRRFHSWGG
ncbi:uncharacterized protein LOC132743403 [Ruditapes philippinarum]|uniref:uncharacterized protein LOC132743403 n=1 Tax=Ruditapes philippinarum TaxID=129788 RepID=UPI00295C0D8A|nr:uncharacterized protein LOC132743403 [Ruditapes philippinarum]